MKRVISSMFNDKKLTRKELKRREFPRLPEDYILVEECGHGATGSVWRAQCVPFKAEVAVKKVNLETVQAEVETFVGETQTMSQLHHPNLLPLYCSFMHKEDLWMVMPYVSGGSLHHIMKYKYPKGLSEAACCTILYETLKGLDYLHKHNVIHRDIKAGNILMGQDGTVWLADFGIAASTKRTSSWGKAGAVRNTFAGSICWMAPEVICSEDYDERADIWSLGITALELAQGLPPHANLSPMKIMMVVMRDDPPELEDDLDEGKVYSKLFKDFVSKCLAKDKADRPSAEQLLSHKFFKAAQNKEFLRNELLSTLPTHEERQASMQKQLQESLANPGDAAAQVEANNVSMWNFNLTCLKKELPSEGSPRASSSPSDMDSPGTAFMQYEARPGGPLERNKSTVSMTSLASSSDVLSANHSQSGMLDGSSENSNAPDWSLPEGMAPLPPSSSIPQSKSANMLKPVRSLGRSASDLSHTRTVTPAMDRRRTTPGSPAEQARAVALQQAAQRRGRFTVVEEGTAPPRPTAPTLAYSRSKSSLSGGAGARSSGRLTDDYHDQLMRESHRLQAVMASRAKGGEQPNGAKSGKRMPVHNIVIGGTSN